MYDNNTDVGIYWLVVNYTIELFVMVVILLCFFTYQMRAFKLQYFWKLTSVFTQTSHYSLILFQWLISGLWIHLLVSSNNIDKYYLITYGFKEAVDYVIIIFELTGETIAWLVYLVLFILTAKYRLQCIMQQLLKLRDEKMWPILKKIFNK